MVYFLLGILTGAILLAGFSWLLAGTVGADEGCVQPRQENRNALDR